MSGRSREDPTTIMIPKWMREKIKEKKRGDETYVDFFKRRLRI
jgi:hypothetical protein